MKRPIVLSALLLAPTVGLHEARAQVTTARNTPTQNAPTQNSPVQSASSMQGILFPHGLLDAALEGRVDEENNIDYANLKGDKNLDAYVAAVAAADLAAFPVLPPPPAKDGDKADEPEKTSKSKNAPEIPFIATRSAELAFWINSYNALMLKALTTAYPIDSPNDIQNLDTEKSRVVAGQTFSFAELRNKIAAMDRRALFALMDGTRSGPPLAHQAYRFIPLNALLEDAVSVIVNDSRNIAINSIQNQVTLSSWYQGIDETFRPSGAREKGDGIRYVLAAYTKTNAARNFLAGKRYTFIFQPREGKLNRKQNN